MVPCARVRSTPHSMRPADDVIMSGEGTTQARIIYEETHHPVPCRRRPCVAIRLHNLPNHSQHDHNVGTNHGARSRHHNHHGHPHQYQLRFRLSQGVRASAAARLLTSRMAGGQFRPGRKAGRELPGSAGTSNPPDPHSHSISTAKARRLAIAGVPGSLHRSRSIQRDSVDRLRASFSTRRKTCGGETMGVMVAGNDPERDMVAAKGQGPIAAP